MLNQGDWQGWIHEVRRGLGGQIHGAVNAARVVQCEVPAVHVISQRPRAGEALGEFLAFAHPVLFSVDLHAGDAHAKGEVFMRHIQVQREALRDREAIQVVVDDLAGVGGVVWQDFVAEVRVEAEPSRVTRPLRRPIHLRTTFTFTLLDRSGFKSDTTTTSRAPVRQRGPL